MTRRQNSCIFGCNTLGVPVHGFPNRKKRPEVFEEWLAIIPKNLVADDRPLKYLKVCDYHFKLEHRTRGHHLTVNAVPSLYLKGVPKVAAEFDKEHNYCLPRLFRSTDLNAAVAVQQETGSATTNHDWVQPVRHSTSPEPDDMQEVYIPTDIPCYIPDVDVSLVIPKTEVCESTDIPCDPLEICVSTDIPCDPLKSCVSTDTPCNLLESCVSTDIPWDMLERCVRSDTPCDPLESCVSTDTPCDPLESCVSTDIPCDLLESCVSTDVHWDMSKVYESNDIPWDKTEVSDSNYIPWDKTEVYDSNDIPWDKTEVSDSNDIPWDKTEVSDSNDIPWDKTEVSDSNDIPWDKTEVYDSNDIPWDMTEVCESMETYDVPEVYVSPKPSNADETQPSTQTLCQVPTNVPRPKGIKDYQREIISLKNKIKRMQKREESLKIRLARAAKIAKSAVKISNNMSEEARIFIQLQCRESGKKSRGRRFSEEEKVLALSLMRKNPTGYGVLSEYFCLPSFRTLRPERRYRTKTRLSESTEPSGEKSSVIYDAFVTA